METDLHEPLPLYHGTSQTLSYRLLRDGWMPTEDAQRLCLTTNFEHALLYAKSLDGVVLRVDNVPIEALVPTDHNGKWISLSDELTEALNIPGKVALVEELSFEHFSVVVE